MQRKKMSLQDLKDLYPSYDPYGHAPTKATQKGFAHKHNPTWMPPKSKLTPAQWARERRKQRAKK
jgi:hypothetical protein